MGCLCSRSSQAQPLLFKQEGRGKFPKLSWFLPITSDLSPPAPLYVISEPGTGATETW